MESEHTSNASRKNFKIILLNFLIHFNHDLTEIQILSLKKAILYFLNVQLLNLQFEYGLSVRLRFRLCASNTYLLSLDPG